MKALKYTGLPKGTHTVIYDARDADVKSGFGGSPIRIEPGDVVPLEAFPNQTWSGNVAAIHIERGLAEFVDVGPDGKEIVAAPPTAPEPTPRPKLQRIAKEQSPE